MLDRTVCYLQEKNPEESIGEGSKILVESVQHSESLKGLFDDIDAKLCEFLIMNFLWAYLFGSKKDAPIWNLFKLRTWKEIYDLRTANKSVSQKPFPFTNLDSYENGKTKHAEIKQFMIVMCNEMQGAIVCDSWKHAINST